jgi:hypothetical protein
MAAATVVATSAAMRVAAAAMTVAAAAMTVAAAAMTVAAAAMTAMAAAADKLYERGCSVAFLVEDIERRQADVRDFFLTESDLIAIFGVRRRHIRCQPIRDCGGAACE